MSTTAQHEISQETQSREIFIVGPRCLHNELLIHVLQEGLGLPCHLTQTLTEERQAARNPGSRSVVLVDCAHVPPRDALANVLDGAFPLGSGILLALFNLDPSMGIEEEALKGGVRGFFYTRDSLDLVLKGIRAVLEGEIWLSREVLTRFALRGIERSPVHANEQEADNMLTPREVQILSIVGTGASNVDIGDKLCISPHTVKTHLYNIYRKIGVPNRFQAALWALRNL